MKSKLIIPIIFIVLVTIIWFGNNLVSGGFTSYEKHFASGEKYFEEGKIEESVRAFGKVIALKPNNIKALHYHAKGLLLLGRKTDAISDYKNILELDKNNTEAKIKLISIYESNGDYELATQLINSIKDQKVIQENKPRKPIANKKSGVYSVNIKLEFEKESNAKVLFTLDGKMPTYDSEVFDKALILENGVYNIRAVTVKNGFMSDVTEINLKVEVKVEVVKFENKEVEKAVRKGLNKYTGEINNQDMSKIKGLFIFENTISAYLNNIETIFTPNESSKTNYINYIELKIDGSQKKYYYNVYSNNVQDLNINDIKKFNNLETIVISSVDNLDLNLISNATNLKELNISNAHNIINLSLMSNFVNVKSLFLIDVHLDKISFISPMTNLQVLDLSYNQIEDVGLLPNLKKLKKLNVSNNNIETLTPLYRLLNLKSLNVESNNVSDISGIQKT